MGAHIERRQTDKSDLKQQKSYEKPQRLVLDAIQEIKQLETVQLKRWQKPAKTG